jgi:uncharacterized protein YmfQ (DUF2313 family)
MAGITKTALKRLLPAGPAWNLTGQAAQVCEGLGDTLDRPRQFLRAVNSEAIPGTAEATIDQWLELLGITVAENTSLGDKRKVAASAIASIGGQSLDYINDRIKTVFPNAYIDEDEAGGVFTFFYYVIYFYSSLSKVLHRNNA